MSEQSQSHHQPLPPFAATAGPRNARIVVVGEAWGEQEEKQRQPFVGESGKELWRMLGEAMSDQAPELHQEASRLFHYGNSWINSRGAWLAAAGILFTNVFAFRPAGNDLETLCLNKKDSGNDYPYPALVRAKYLKREFFGELDRLSREIEIIRPNLILALGNTACWATLRATNIGSIRGTIAQASISSITGGGFKVLPTYHPAGILRNWAWRPIVLADLMKGAREAQFPEIRRPERVVLINPTIEEVEEYTEKFLAEATELSPDIETAYGQISCIGFAPNIYEAMVVPFLDKTKPGWNYWPSQGQEERAWLAVRRLLESPIPKVGQNFIYDLQYITKLGIKPAALANDSMLMHHSMYPELQKGLGFLGSVYTNEASWKLMRRQKSDTEKRDE
jgi:uracil-DNA glycosylase